MLDLEGISRKARWRPDAVVAAGLLQAIFARTKGRGSESVVRNKGGSFFTPRRISGICIYHFGCRAWEAHEVQVPQGNA